MDYSGLSTLSCPRKFEYLQVHRKCGSNGSPATKFGTLWHKIMEYELQGDPNPFNRAVADLGWEDPQLDYRTAEKARLAYTRWKNQYPPFPKVYMTEEPFSVRLPGIEEPYEGRLDGIVDADAQEGKGVEKWVLDFKTTSLLPSDWVALYRVSNQFKLYLTVARMFDSSVVGVCVDLLHVTKGNKAGPSQDDKNGTRLYRVFFRYEEEHCAEAVADFAVGVQTVQFYKQLGYFPKNTKVCREFNKACEFLDVCDTADPELRERILAAMDDYTFDPLKE